MVPVASGDHMAQTVKFQEILRRLAIIDEGFVEDQAGLGLGLRGDWVLDPKTAALVRVGALAAGATEAEITGVLLAIAPVIGLGRVVGAGHGVADALGYDIEAALLDPDVP